MFEGNILAGNAILERLVKTGKVSFTEADLKGEKKPGIRKVLYALGAYKNTPISDSLQYNFGIRTCKRCIHEGIPLNKESIIANLFREELANYYNILKCRPTFDNRHNYVKYDLKCLSTWSNISKGKDLFIPGLGGFDINEAYLKCYENRSPYGATIPAVSVKNIIIRGYFPDTPHRYALEKIYTDSRDTFKWVYIHKFPIARLDELIDLDILGMFNIGLSISSVLTRMDDMTERDLRLDYRDRMAFDYKKKVKEFSNISGLILPKNGVELKKQARRFSNCSGSYVNKILSGKTAILYNEREMLEIDIPTMQIVQHLGCKNTCLPKDTIKLRKQQLR